MNLPLGFRYAAMYAGIRKVAKDDLALIVSDTPASAAAVFTRNRVVAGPVVIARRHLKSSRGRMQAILVNAGNANCATRSAEDVALETSRAAADILGIPAPRVLPASTGVIGVELDSALILRALPKLKQNLDPERFAAVAEAILTTDTRAKTAFAEVKGARIAGMTKGSGMIQPRMATTLGFVMTDANIPVAKLRGILARVNERSYSRISVDGDTSTNDTLVLMANGCSGVRPDPKEFAAFEEGVAIVTETLARQIARDGEGAKKLVTIDVTGAANPDAAAHIARVIANSPLVKTAIAGSDPNWGRILSAAGNAGVAFDPAKVDIALQGVTVCRSGMAARFSESDLKSKLDQAECSIRFQIHGKGKGSARFWTCDLTEGYIRINGSYRT